MAQNLFPQRRIDPRTLRAFDLDGAAASYSRSVIDAVTRAGLAEETSRRWIRRFANEKFVRRLDHKYSDVRTLVPDHYRLRRDVCGQLPAALSAYDSRWGFCAVISR